MSLLKARLKVPCALKKGFDFDFAIIKTRVNPRILLTRREVVGTS